MFSVNVIIKFNFSEISIKEQCIKCVYIFNSFKFWLSILSTNTVCCLCSPPRPIISTKFSPWLVFLLLLLLASSPSGKEECALFFYSCMNFSLSLSFLLHTTVWLVFFFQVCIYSFFPPTAVMNNFNLIRNAFWFYKIQFYRIR